MLKTLFLFLDDRMRKIGVALTLEGHWEAHMKWHM